jgi:hypothetical protein
LRLSLRVGILTLMSQEAGILTGHRLRHSGTQALRHSGTQALRHSGTQALRHSGTQALRHSGTQAHYILNTISFVSTT